MKLLLKKNVANLGIIGDVVEVKPGYARNYLLPQALALMPTKGNLKRVEADKQRYLEQLAKEKAALKEKAKLVDGKEITIAARANEEGHLYGSIGPAQITAALAEGGMFVEPSNIILDNAIRQLDKYDVRVVFDADITAAISVWVVPLREGGEATQEAQAAPESAQQ
ncbi:MAG: 50S ribosomal protein L9 [Planctomycetes bacterium]|jgi:large subunit ribosomal protein L9|nr:50S ribosomal protein L9 [Planctomycetota bacterium]